MLSKQGKSFINYQGAHGYTPLHVAAIKCNASVTEQLIEARCQVHIQDKNGETPLHLAAQQGNARIKFSLAKKKKDKQKHNRTNMREIASYCSYASEQILECCLL